MTNQESHGARNHKDRLFSDIFSHKEYALSLFNAVNGTDYTDEGSLEIVTLESVVYITMHNDLAVCFHDSLQLFEQQSTRNPNMPLREFLYSAEEYDKWLIDHEKDVFGSTLVRIPAPRCFELYNGTANEPERTEKHLSDAFASPSPGYEWTVYLININAGKNMELMENCHPLNAYAVFVQKVREWQNAGLELKEAIDKAIDYCIENQLMAKYFAENKVGVMKMMLSEYSAKIHEKSIREESLAEGERKGRAEGRAEEQLSSIRNLMETLQLSAQQAMDALKIPMDKRKEYAEQL